MNTAALSSADRTKVLRFAASFLWADLEIADAERAFLTNLARELDVEDAPRELAGLFARPPFPEDVDPAAVDASVADEVRRAALRAIAADGRVHASEMEMFEELDDLLPKSEPARGA